MPARADADPGAAGSSRRIVVVQTAPRFGDRDGNLAALDDVLRDVRADLVVLPELATTGYAFRNATEARAWAEPYPDGPTVAWAARTSATTGGGVVVGFAERDGDRLYNAAVLAAGGRPLGRYRKAHLFGFETDLYTPGASPPPVIACGGLRVGLMICFDWIFPEMARVLALAGADMIAHPSNLMLPLCQRAMPVRALENRLFTVTANRVGAEHRPPRPPLAFTGRSLVCGPDGEVLAEAPPDVPASLAVDVDLDRARVKDLPPAGDPLAARRPGLYTSLAKSLDPGRV